MSEIRVDTISEKTSANGVAVDGLTIKDGGVAATAASTITTASADPQLTIISTEAGGGASPIIDLYRNSSSPADDDVLGQFRYYGENSADEKIEYVRVKAGVSDVTDGTEDSNYTITTFTGGSQFGRLNILPTETVFNENSTDVDFRVESNGNDHVLFVDGGNDHVNIGGSSDAGGLLNVFGKAVFKASDNSDNIELLTTDADGSVGPNLKMYRNSSSPADNDDIGIINFVGENDAGEEVNYAQIKSIIKDVTNGTDANMFFVNGGNDRVGIGSASPESVLHVEEGTSPKITVRSADGTSASIKLQRINENDASTDFELKNDGGVFKIISDNSSINERPLATFESAQITFNEDSHDIDFRVESNGNTEMFVVDGGDDVVYVGSITGQNHAFVVTHGGANQHISRFRNTNAAPEGVIIEYTNAAPDNTSTNFLELIDTGATRLQVQGTGNVQNHDNSYGQISDERIKQNITDANSQWADIKSLKVKNFERKDDVATYGAGKKVQIGLIAQECELVSPGLVNEQKPTAGDIRVASEFGTLYTSDDAETQDVLYVADDKEVIDGDKNVGDIKTSATKQIGDVKEVKEQVKGISYSVLYMKAIKALQEAMTRIETLETKVAALEE